MVSQRCLLTVLEQGQRNQVVGGWEKEMELRRKTTLCTFFSSFVKVWGMSTFQQFPAFLGDSVRAVGHQSTAFDSGTQPTLNLCRLEEYFGEGKPLWCAPYVLSLGYLLLAAAGDRSSVKQRLAQSQHVEHLVSSGKESDSQELHCPTQTGSCSRLAVCRGNARGSFCTLLHLTPAGL